MTSARSSFALRCQEVELYFSFLESADATSAKISFVRDGIEHEMLLTPDTQTILRANGFLVLYNLIEATVRDGLRAICESVSGEGLLCEQLAIHLRRIWVSSRYAFGEKNRAGHDKYVGIAQELVQHVVDNASIDMSAEEVVGSLDASEIRRIARRYGFSSATSVTSKGGEKLVVVKARRNDLAHGLRSFIECGREYSTPDLIAIKDQVVVYLGDILNNIGDYISARRYVAS